MLGFLGHKGITLLPMLLQFYASETRSHIKWRLESRIESLAFNFDSELPELDLHFLSRLVQSNDYTFRFRLACSKLLARCDEQSISIWLPLLQRVLEAEDATQPERRQAIAILSWLKCKSTTPMLLKNQHGEVIGDEVRRTLELINSIENQGTKT